MSEDEGTIDSDGDLDELTSKKLIENVLNLSTKLHVKKPTRTEPTLNVSEYNLVGAPARVNLEDLTKPLKNRKGHARIAKSVCNAEQKVKTLPKPLEKPQADRLRRTIAYENTALELDKWDPIVTAMRASTHTKFPLRIDVDMSNDTNVSEFRVKSELDKQLEALEPEVEVYNIEEQEEKFPLSMEEILEKRQETAKMRAQLSYREAKARRQGKIKSKKYHRIQKRERVKQQLKEFELLQKTDPEAALQKLEEIEKARAEERVSLRHKGTGKWARNKQIRAKYDKDSRQVLAQQLTISRDLTQKIHNTNDTDSEPEELPLIKNVDESKNPWTNGIPVSKEVDEFVTGYRRYWEHKNGVNENTNMEIKPEKKASESTSEWEVTDMDVDQEFAKHSYKLQDKFRDKLKRISKTLDRKKVKKMSLKKSKKVSLEIPIKVKAPIIDEELIETVHRNGDDLNKLKQILKNIPEAEKANKRKSKILSKIKAPVIDEELGDANKGDDFNKLKKILKKTPETVEPSNIDPNKFMHVKEKHLPTELPDLMSYDDNEEGADQTDIITEAFENDDIVDDFNKQKEAEIEEGKPKSVDLNLPGWGSWGGKDLKKSTRRQRRFIVKFPEKMPRKDENKGDLIISEKGADKLKAHLVSELPFPFKSVKDYEASIRAPIGSSFVPETSFRKLIMPAVTTRMGTIIEPMNQDILLRKRKVQ